MVETADIVVIGAGFAGAATAYHLTARGARRLVVLEAEARPGHHASGRNAALAFQVLADRHEALLAVEGARFIAEPPAGFADRPLLRRCGSLLVAGEQGMDALRQSGRDAQALGIPTELLSAVEAGRRVSVLADAPIAGALWTPSDGVVDIAALLNGFLRAAADHGAQVRCGEAVVAIESANHRVTRVRTARSVIETRLIVNAAGGWAGVVGHLAGVGARTLQPRRRHMFLVGVDVPIEADWPFVWHNDVDVYFRPERGAVLSSPCDATPHAAAEPALDPAAFDVLCAKLTRAFPRLGRPSVQSSWACLRTFAADERFVIGPDPELDGLIWVAALGGHGMTTSPAVGRFGASAALGESSPEMKPFAPARLRAVV